MVRGARAEAADRTVPWTEIRKICIFGSMASDHSKAAKKGDPKAHRAEGGKPRSKKRPRSRRGSREGGVRLRRISATEAVRNFARVVDEVRTRGVAVIIEQRGRPACEIRPTGPPRFTGTDLLALLERLPRPDPGFCVDVESAIQEGNQPAASVDPWAR